ncbi:SDR family oxidoreductase [Pseudomonas sp. v388]|uniref:SDR family NAD(P)-dependent oxidoreductase n=1 Tax=Pseudomonas sp. v388 TaxID=2479849 RepID=UPI000F775E2B|nr:SDR family NAD(P)-dependent oxidoreductase [Pseudomonas sp. v388]RRV08470.1 SDR family oxidoreductase [Pseudomonas sp. v388]
MNKSSRRTFTDPRRIWLTAADSDIGLAVAGELLEAGHWLALTATHQAPLLLLAGRYPGRVLLVIGDISNGPQLRAMADRIDSRWGSLDTAICNAQPGTPTDVAQAQGVPCADMLTTCLYVQEALALLRRGQRAHLVAIAGPAASDGVQVSSAVTAELRQVFKALRVDLADESIDVSIIDPAQCSTPTWSTDNAAQHIIKQLDRTVRVLDTPISIPFALNLRLLAMTAARARLALNRYLLRPLSSKKGR